MFSLLGVTMQYKFCAWAGATFALAAFLNKRKHDSDSSQILSGVLFAVSGLVLFPGVSTGPLVRAQRRLQANCEDRRMGDVPRGRKREAGRF